MSDLIQRLHSQNKIHCPAWMPSNTQYLTVMGSTAYGCSMDDSDVDYYGWAIEPLRFIFPASEGLIPGLDNIPKFEVYQEHHVEDGKVTRDFQIFGLVKYVRLLCDCNPNIIDSIFTPIDCVQTNSRLGQILRGERKSFLHKGAFHRFRGYSYAQLHKVDSKGEKTGKRKEIRDRYGFDTKFLMNVVRLSLECEQLLIEGDLDLRRHSDLLKAVRTGEWTPERTKEWFTKQESYLEDLYKKSHLPYSWDRVAVRSLVFKILEEHYGSLSNFARQESKSDQILNEIRRLVNV